MLSELGDPRNAFNLSFDLARGPLTVGYSPTTAQSSIYNVRGRFFFAGAKYKF